MSAEKSPIDSLFRDALHQAEMPVDPAIWQGVSAGIGSGAAGGAAAGGLGIVAKVAIGVAAAAGIGTTAWVVLDEDEALETVATQQTVRQEATEPLVSESTVTYEEAAAQLEQDAPELQEELAAPQTQSTDEVHTPEPALTASSTPTTSSVSESAQTSQSEGSTEIITGGIPASPSADETAMDPELSAEFEATRLHPITPNYALSASYDGAALYTWYVDGEEVAGGRQFAHTFNTSGQTDVTLEVSDAHGNTDAFTLTLDVPEVPVSSVNPPNVFSPDGDGQNDVYDLRIQAEHCTLLRMLVVDRSGKLLFESDDQTKFWDGTDTYGNPCPTGQYVIQYWMAGDDGVMHQDRLVIDLFAP